MQVNSTPVLFGSPTMSSREIAALTGKEHKNVLADIRKMLEELGIISANFSAVYKDQQDIERPCFNLPRREVEILVTGYSIPLRAKVIDRLHELESQAKPTFTLPDFTDPALAAEAWATEYRAKVTALKQIEADKPKVAFAMAVRTVDGTCSVSDFAKVIGWGRNSLFAQLREDGYLMSDNAPYQRYTEQGGTGLFRRVQGQPWIDKEGNTQPRFVTRITGKGQVYFARAYAVGFSSIPSLQKLTSTHH